MDKNDVDAFKQAFSEAEGLGLQAMNISWCSVPSGSLAIILPYLKYLTKLYVSGNSLNEADCGALAACTLLTELHIGCCFRNSPGSIARILPHLKDLTKLYVHDNSLSKADRKAIKSARERGIKVHG
jgi:hypothetical protein